MPRPAISWNPARYLHSALHGGYPVLEDWLAQAYVLGLRFVEVHQALLPSRAPEMLRQIRRRLEGHELRVCLLTCAPDFTHPEPLVREAHFHDMLGMLDVAKLLGAPCLRVTAGCQHDAVSRDDGLIWCAELIQRLADSAQRAGLKLALENHFRDRTWPAPDFAHEPEVFLEVCRRTRSSPLGISFDTSHPLLSATDPLGVLEPVKERVCHLRASDRFPGQYGHTVVGEGAVDFDAVLRCLSEAGFSGAVSVEDGSPEGDEGLARGLRFVRAKVAQWWP
jgi:sugar phosphate isomerase/epimerase